MSKSKENLLKISLSNGTVGVYQVILRGLGQYIKAMKPQTLQTTETRQNDKSSHQVSLFTATIQQLERGKLELANNLERAQVQVRSQQYSDRNDNFSFIFL